MKDKTLVILQPQFCPWIGVFEQIACADIYVHYDDVQLPQGRSFTSRVQIKTPNGVQWLTVPIVKRKSNTIQMTALSPDNKWKEKHLRTLEHAYSKAPFKYEMLSLLTEIYQSNHETISALNIDALEKISDYYNLGTTFYKSSDVNIGGKSTHRLIDICKHYSASRYITGWGAKNYIEHEKFDDEGIKLCYMDYQKKPYLQQHDGFTPYVSILDLIANCGKEGKKMIMSEPVYWRDFKW